MTRTRPRGDDGNAALEFLGLGVLLMVPLVYLVLTLAQVQAASMAADRAAALGARAFTESSGESSGRRAVAGALELALRDDDVAGRNRPQQAGGFDVRCSATPCLRPGARVEVAVEVRVPLPGVPAFLSGSVPTLVRVRARQTATVDKFRARP